MQPAVLVVEDDPTLRGLIETVLTLEGFAVRTASDGDEGLEALRADRPAVALIDVMMPGLGGLGLLDELAADGNDVAVIVMTGRQDAAEEVRDRLGDDRVLEKPFDVDELVDRVRHFATALRKGASS